MYAKSKTAQRRPCGKNCLCYRVNDNCRHDGNLYCSFDFSSTGFCKKLVAVESVRPDFFLFINFRTICDFVRLFVFSYRLGNFICSRSHDRTGGSKNFEKA